MCVVCVCVCEVPTNTSTNNTHSYREIQDDVDDIVQLVNLQERIQKDSENVFQRHELNTVRIFFSPRIIEITHNNLDTWKHSYICR